MNTVTYRVTGISPMLMNNPESMGGGDPDAITVGKNIPKPEDEAATKVYRLPSGQLFVPSIWALKSVQFGAKGLRIGKKFATTILPGALFSVDVQRPVFDPETGDPITEYEIDVQRAVVQRQGIRRARPRLPRWAFDVTFEYDPVYLAPSQITTFFEIAGKLCGVGDYSPRNKGPYGRFTVELIAEDGVPLAEAA